MNPANQIKTQAQKLKKSYWEYLSGKGFVKDVEHDELVKLNAYKTKCEERRNNRKED